MNPDQLHRLNALAEPASEADRFAVRDGVLSGYVDKRWRREPAILEILREAICDHDDAMETTRTAAMRFGFGIEIGAGAAKLYGTVWPSGQATVDVKLQLTRLSEMQDTHSEYPEQIDQLVRAFQRQSINSDIGWLVEAANIDLAEPSRIRAGLPESAWDITYVYGTQGPRDARRMGISLPPYLRVLSGAEEGGLIADVIVPPDFARPGAMAIEVGSGSTELILNGANGSKHTLALAIGGNAQSRLDAVVRGIETNDLVAHAKPHLETDAQAAMQFLSEARKLGSSNRALFMNPNRDSATFRRQSPRRPIDVIWARDYGASNALDKFAPKAKILAALAQAFGFTVIHEGRAGGLKRAMADFVGKALHET